MRRDPHQPPGPDKPGLLSLRAPSALEVDVGALPAGIVLLGFLRSYDPRMGSLDVRCTRGCACNQSTINGWHNRQSSVLAFGTIAARGATQACTLQLTHRARIGGKAAAAAMDAAPAAESDRKGAETCAESKFKILAMIVPPFALETGDRDLSSGNGFTEGLGGFPRQKAEPKRQVIVRCPSVTKA